MHQLRLVVFLVLVGLTTCTWPEFYYYPKSGAKAVRLQTKQLLGSTFRIDNQTVFVVHGWRCTHLTSFVANIRSSLLKNTPQNNVIMVDWYGGAKYDYDSSVRNTKAVGREIAKFIDNNNLTLSLVYCVGHSLGAHICGFAGKYLNGKMGRITGLDPAGPSFRDQKSSYRLMPSDAQFVDVIHTTQVAGTKISSGYFDFFPKFDNNPWTNQPKCDGLKCDHRAACTYFAASTSKSCKFTSTVCTKYKTESSGTFNGCQETGSTTMRMGYYATKNGRPGNYVLKPKTYCEP